MEPILKYFVFKLDEQKYALKLKSVEKVIRVVELISVPDSINYLLGLINVEGRIIPVFDIRKRFRLHSREIDLEDRIIISPCSTGTIAVIVDEVKGIVDFNTKDIRQSGEIYPNMDLFIEGVWKSGDETILIYDVDKLFPLEKNDELKSFITSLPEKEKEFDYDK